MNAKPSAPKHKLQTVLTKSEKLYVPQGKTFLPDQGPIINGSGLSYSSFSKSAFKIPEPRA